MRAWRYCSNCDKLHREKGNCCCPECAVAMIVKTIEQLKKKEGPIYNRWKKRMKAAARAL